MLQWMGGSRKKVTTSRKSTQKRQKQYYEQRKRQQQQQQQNPNGIESYFDKKDPSTQCHENNRSLDILSLLNLSKNGQDFTSKFPQAVQGRGSSNGQHKTPNSQTADCSNTIQMQNENFCPSEHVEFRETRNVSNHLKETGCEQKFLFDFSSSSQHDASKGNNEKDPMKMTSDHKLSVVDMIGDDGQNSSSRGNLVHENHVSFSVEGLGKVEMETPVHSPQQPTRKFTYGYPAPSKIFKGSSHYSKNLNHSLEDQFPELEDIPTDACSLKLPPYLGHDAEDFLCNDEFSENRVDHDRFKWHEKSSFLDDDNFLDDNYGVSWNNRSCDLDYMTRRKCDKSDFSFEGSRMQKRRARVDPPGSFNVSGLSSPYKQQIDHRFDFMTPDITQYTNNRCNSEFNETTLSSDWPTSFKTEDTRANLHLSREDSFMSYPEWREETKNPSFISTEKQKTRQHAANSRSPFSMKNTTFSHEFGIKSPKIWQQHESMTGPHFSTQRDNDWLFEERSNIESYSKNQFDPKIYDDEKPSSSRSKHGVFSSKYFSNKHEHEFCQKVNPSQSSPVFSHIKQEYGHQDPPHDGFFNEEKDDSNVQLQKSVSTRESESVTLPAVTSTFHQHKENNNKTHDTNYSSSKNDTSTNVSDSQESQVKTPDLSPCANAILSPEPSEGGSSSVEMPHKLEQECQDGTQTTLLTQNEHKETEESGPNSCKVMMLGRFVLQLV